MEQVEDAQKYKKYKDVQKYKMKQNKKGYNNIFFKFLHTGGEAMSNMHILHYCYNSHGHI